MTPESSAGAFGQVREGMRVDEGDKFGLRVAVKIISRRLIKKVQPILVRSCILVLLCAIMKQVDDGASMFERNDQGAGSAPQFTE